LQKILVNANKAIEKSTKFINKIKSKQLAYANRAKSIPENATIRKEYIKCGKEMYNKFIQKLSKCVSYLHVLGIYCTYSFVSNKKIVTKTKMD
jgi:hypothetical protein